MKERDRVMVLERTLEPEVMDSEEDAREYNRMDHSRVNQDFVAQFLEFAQGVWDQHGEIGAAQSGDEVDDDDPVEFRLGDVLDAGTGTALIPVELCKRHGNCRVMAIDQAVNMLNLAVYNLEIAGLTERVTLTQVDAKKMIFDDDMFDVTLSNSILHHLARPLECLAEMVRVTRPGGIFFVRDLMRPEDPSVVTQLVETYAGSETEYSQKLFKDSLHAALSLAEIRQWVAELGFDPESVQPTSDRHWTWTARQSSVSGGSR